MPYYISYKGKKLGAPLSRHEAEEKLLVLSRCFKQLEIVKENHYSIAANTPMTPAYTETK